MSEIQVKAIEPYEIDPLVLAEHLVFEVPWWRLSKRRRLRREITRLAAL